MTRLTDKIRSYSVKNGIDFNEPFTGSWPTQYGPTSFSGGGQQIINANNGLTSSANDGPFPGQYSWRFQNGNGKAARLRWSSYGNQATPGANYVRPQNFTYSIWVRINSMDQNPFYNRAYAEYTNYLNNGQPGSDDDWYQGWYMGYIKQTDPAQPNYNKPIINLYTGYQDIYIADDDKGQFLDYGKWYLTTIRKTKINSTTVEVEFMINGVVKQTRQHTYGDNAMAIYDHGQSNNSVWVDHSLGCSFLGTNTDFPQSVIQEIYKYGAPIQTDVKYFNGTSWQTSSNQQVYDGSKWIPMYANRWDGSAWQPL